MNLLAAVNQVFEATDQPSVTSGSFTLPEVTRCVNDLNEAISTVWARIPMDLKPVTTELLAAQPNVSEYSLTSIDPTRIQEVLEANSRSTVNMASPNQGLVNFYGQTGSVSVWYVLNGKLFLSPTPTVQTDYLVTGEQSVPVLSSATQDLPFPTEFQPMLVGYARWKTLSFLQEPTANVEWQLYERLSKLFIDRLYEQGPTYIFNSHTQAVVSYLAGR
jgi:hypothetical protein